MPARMQPRMFAAKQFHPSCFSTRERNRFFNLSAGFRLRHERAIRLIEPDAPTAEGRPPVEARRLAHQAHGHRVNRRHCRKDPFEAEPGAAPSAPARFHVKRDKSRGEPFGPGSN